jgi:hypothetical protein
MSIDGMTIKGMRIEGTGIEGMTIKPMARSGASIEAMTMNMIVMEAIHARGDGDVRDEGAPHRQSPGFFPKDAFLIATDGFGCQVRSCVRKWNLSFSTTTMT